MLIILPEELIREVMTHLVNHSDLGNLLSVCKTLNRIGSVDVVWKKKGFLKYNNSTRNNDNTEQISAGSGIIQSQCPSPRLCHSSVIHEDKMYIYGGHNTAVDSQRFSEVKNDLFGFDLKTKSWSKYSIKNMPSKTEHSSVVYKDNLYLYGGYSGYTFSNSTFMFNLTSGNHCSLVRASGEIPNGRSAHIGVVYGDKMFIFGGWDGSTQNNDLFSFDFENSFWTKIKPNSSSSVSSDTSDADTDTNSNSVSISRSSSRNVTLNNEKYSVPCARCSHTGVVSLERKKLYVFGGYGVNGGSKSYLNDLWSYDFETNSWKQIETKGNAPSPRSRMRMVEFSGKLYIHGGWDKNVHFDDLFEFDLDTKKWTRLDYNSNSKVDESMKMGQHSLSINNSTGILYIFGGYNSEVKKSTSDLYAYRLTASKNLRKMKTPLTNTNTNDSSTSSTPISSPLVNIREKRKGSQVYNPFVDVY